MSAPSVLCFMLLSACSVGFDTQNIFADGHPAYESDDDKDSIRSESFETEFFPIERIQNEIPGIAYTGHLARTRRKRMTKIISFAAKKASKILRKLLLGTQRLPATSPYIELSLKRGSFLNAVNDFYSFGPTGVATYYEQGIKIMIGQAGDKVIRLTTKGTSGYPELDVRKSPDDATPTIYRIEYREN